MVVFPNAKINIGLNIISKRPDGYHDLETVFYPIPFFDVLEIIESKDLKFSSSGIPIPGNTDSNLCLKAFQLLKADFNIPNIEIILYKNIPIGAGLGGGSSDAAYTLKLLNSMFDLKLSNQILENYAKQLGSDCAFFINNTPVFATQKGDCFESINLNLKGYYIALAQPSIHVSTQMAYQGIQPLNKSLNLYNEIENAITKWKNTIKNDFENNVFKLYPSLEIIKKNFYKSNAIYASMSGSGSSVFGIFDFDPASLNLNSENCKMSIFKLE